MTSKQEKFFDVSTEPPPLNRRIYAKAKAPFEYLWTFVCWAGLPWAQAVPFAFVAAAVVQLFAYGVPESGHWAAAAYDVFVVGIVWTVFLGAFFAVVKIFRSIFH